ncbi:MAG: DNA-binding response regulator [candidate division Zixibacteria bacterium 4484_95]|nr:MAG: DNA-binding response regulator [candidate division Zixibacteria bacterium 4484_95]
MFANKARILIVEDDRDIVELIEYNLRKEGYQVVTATSGEEGLEAAKSEKPDMALLDLMLPGIDGLEVCKILKTNPTTANIQIIIVSAKGEESDVVTGLELGADDYIIKPFSPKILIARIRACLRRKKQQLVDQKSVIKIEDLVIHPGRHEVLINNITIPLTLSEFRLLHFLASRPGWVFTRYQIVEAIRGDDYIVTDRTVDVQVVGLRKKLGKYSKYIETVRGIGYRFKE